MLIRCCTSRFHRKCHLLLVLLLPSFGDAAYYIHLQNSHGNFMQVSSSSRIASGDSTVNTWSATMCLVSSPSHSLLEPLGEGRATCGCSSCPKCPKWQVGGAAYTVHCDSCCTYRVAPFWLSYWLAASLQAAWEHGGSQWACHCYSCRAAQDCAAGEFWQVTWWLPMKVELFLKAKFQRQNMKVQSQTNTWPDVRFE